MNGLTIVCDSCGHHAANTPPLRRLAVASQDISSQGIRPTALPRHCPQCGVALAHLQAGDEFLIGLARVAPGPTPRRRDA